MDQRERADSIAVERLLPWAARHVLMAGANLGRKCGERRSFQRDRILL
jgi:hypothetical protein